MVVDVEVNSICYTFVKHLKCEKGADTHINPQKFRHNPLKLCLKLSDR